MITAAEAQVNRSKGFVRTRGMMIEGFEFRGASVGNCREQRT